LDVVIRNSAASAVLVLFALAACQGPPARLVAGLDGTVVVNNVRPVRIPVRVFDAAGHILPDTAVRFQWTSGVPIPISSHGVVTCTQAGDATLRASVGSLVTQVGLRCRPVFDVRGGGVLNIVVGGPSQELAFEAVDSAGRPVTPITARVSYDSTIVRLEGWRIRARAPGSIGIEISIGDSWAHWFVQVYERAVTLEGMRPGHGRVVPVRLAGGEMHRLQLPASPPSYFVTMLPGRDTRRVPRLAFVDANCLRQNLPDGYACFALPGASVIAYHPREDHPTEEWSGAIAVFREVRP
jgi:hypothetical protein